MINFIFILNKFYFSITLTLNLMKQLLVVVRLAPKFCFLLKWWLVVLVVGFEL